MEYNTSRSKLCMPEYGRNVQSMVEFLLTIEDRQKRLKNAEFIIELMAILTPHLKTIEDYKHKLWDHLHRMTDFKLDVDGPYPAPTPEETFKKPETIPYPQSHAKHRHFGQNFDSLLARAMEEKDPEKRQGFTQTLGYYMKLSYTNWHKEPVHDDMIKNELAQLSDGLLRYESGGYRVHFDTRQQPSNSSNYRNNKNFNNRKKFNNKGGGNSGERSGGGNPNQLSGGGNPNHMGGGGQNRNNNNNKNYRGKNNNNK